MPTTYTNTVWNVCTCKAKCFLIRNNKSFFKCFIVKPQISCPFSVPSTAFPPEHYANLPRLPRMTLTWLIKRYQACRGPLHLAAIMPSRALHNLLNYRSTSDTHYWKDECVSARCYLHTYSSFSFDRALIYTYKLSRSIISISYLPLQLINSKSVCVYVFPVWL